MVLRRSNSIVVRMRARAGTLYTRARHLYAQARGGSRVCTSHRVTKVRALIQPPKHGRGYSEPAVREPAESPDTAPIIASVRVGGWTVDDLNAYLAGSADDYTAYFPSHWAGGNRGS